MVTVEVGRHGVGCRNQAGEVTGARSCAMKGGLVAAMHSMDWWGTGRRQGNKFRASNSNPGQGRWETITGSDGEKWAKLNHFHHYHS